MAHEPRQKLFMKSPRKAFQLTGRKILLIGALLKIEDEKKGINIKLAEEMRIAIHFRWLSGEF